MALPAIIRVSGGHEGIAIAGRTVLERITLAALEADAAPVIILSLEAPPAWLSGMPGVRWTQDENEAREWSGRVFLLIETAAIYDSRLIRWVASSATEPGRARTVRVDGRPVLSKIHYGERGEEKSPSLLEAVPKNWLAPVRNRGERDYTYEWVLSSLQTEDRGMLSRGLERPLSHLLTRLGWRLPTHPLPMLLVGAAIGAGVCWLLSRGTWGFDVLGALALWIYSVHDGTLGELGRLKLNESRFSRGLRYALEHLTRAGVACSIGYARWIAFSDRTAPLIAAGTAAVFGLLGALLAGPTDSSQDYMTRFAGEDRRRFAMLRAVHDRRDLNYLLLAFAVFKKTVWYLPLAAAQAVITFLALAYARLKLKRK